MKGQALLIAGVVIAAAIIALAIAQGEVNITQINQSTNTTNYINITNDLGVILPWENLTGYPGASGLVLGTNVTWTGLTDIQWANISYPGVTLPAGNVTNATQFQASNYTFPENVSVKWLFVERLCLDKPTCYQFAWSNGTHLILNNSA